MPHQCVHCKRIIPLGSKELLEGCDDCGGRFFFYIKDEQLQKIKENPIEIPKEERKVIEKDIREMAGITDEEAPVILDLESVRAIGSGKFEIDLVNLFRKDRPLIYKLEEGKYIIDLASTLNKDIRDIKEIREPDGKSD
jgi:predicted  nucleic acid-binding Zn-ribbon protein